MTARYTQPSQGPLDGLIDHSLEITAAALDLVDQVARHVERLAYVIEERLTAIVDRVRTRIDESRRPALLLFEHDLREHDLRQVLACVAIDDLDGVAVTHQACNSFEGYVAAGLRVV